MNRQQRAMLLLGLLLMGAAMLGSANAPAREARVAEQGVLPPLAGDSPERSAARDIDAPRARSQ